MQVNANNVDSFTKPELDYQGTDKTATIQSTVLNPNDPVIEYDPDNPPVRPAYGQIGKWVRTTRITKNTDVYKAYIYKNLRFRLKFPKGIDMQANDGKQYPIIVMFHGLGEAGDLYDNEKQLTHGWSKHRNAVEDGTFNGFVLYPQSFGGWSDSELQEVKELIGLLTEQAKVDPFRVNIHGLSNGGKAVWRFLIANSKLVASALPMSATTGDRSAATIHKIKFTPIWNSQGGKDTNPTPSASASLYELIQNYGGNIKYTLYEDIGHSVWNKHYNEADFFPFMNRANSVNPWPLYEQKEFCPGENITLTLGVNAGFEAYQWRKNGIVIPGATANTYQVAEVGMYDVRVMHKGAWSYWSPAPVEVKWKEATLTPPIQLSAQYSRVIPSPDGRNHTQLELPEGPDNLESYEAYTWKKAGSNTVIGTGRLLQVSEPGEYIASVKEKFGCSSNYAPAFKVIDAHGTGAPDPAIGFNAVPVSKTEIELNWSDNPNATYNETGFEIYRSERSGEAYTFVALTQADVYSFMDTQLESGKNYYYIIRAVNEEGASANSEEATASTIADTQVPTTPGNLRVVRTTDNSVTLAWEPSSDDVGIYKYDIYKNGLKAVVTENTSVVVYNLKKGETYNFVVKARDFTENISPASNQVTALAGLSGLFYSYYEGTWSKLPNFDNLTPVKTGKIDNFDLSPKNRNNEYAFRFEGVIRIETAGEYTFYTSSDDGSKLYIDGAQIVNNDGLHAASEKYGKVNLSKGFYAIKVTFFEKSGDDELTVKWKGPGIYKQVIPDEVLGDGFTLPDPPALPSDLATEVISYQQINLSWQDKSHDESGFQLFRATNPEGPYLAIATVEANETQYQDRDLAPETTYYYKAQAIGSNGESGMTVAISATTEELPPAPLAPENLIGTALSSTTIRLNWEDKSTNESGFEIFRSTNDNLNYQKITTTAANATAYQDEELFANVTYFYKIVAIGVGGNTTSNEDSVKTLNNLPVLAEIGNRTVKYGTVQQIALSASDQDGELLTFSAQNLPGFASLQATGEGTALLELQPQASDEGVYTFTIQVEDENEGFDSEEISLTVNDNNVPVLEPVPDVALAEGDILQLQLAATETDVQDTLKWEVGNLPGFISLTKIDHQNAVLGIQPGYVHAGTYPLTVKVTDSRGGVDVKSFTVIVTEKDPNVKVMVNFSHTTTAPSPWNNLNSVSSSSLLNDQGETTGITLDLQPTVWKAHLEGDVTGNNSGVYSDAVIKDYYYFGIFGAPERPSLNVSGLDVQRTYSFTFFASSKWTGVADNGTTEYTINGAKVALYTQNNRQNTVTIHNISPDANGQVQITLSKAEDGTAVGYLNALVIESAFDDGSSPAAPAAFAVEYANNQVEMQWKDVPFNETGFEIFRSQTENGPYTQIGTASANATSFADKNVNGNNTYFYKVRAFNANGLSAFSEVASVGIPANPPVITPLENIVVEANSSLTVPVSISSVPQGDVSLNVYSLPSFARFTDFNNGTGEITLMPGSEDIGWYYGLELTATDDYGSRSEWFDIEVKKEKLYAVNLNFTKNALAGTGWNNTAKAPQQNDLFANLTDETGNTTNVNVKFLTAWGGDYNQGATTGDNSGMVPDNVLKEYYWFGLNNTPQSVQFEISGLEIDKLYAFKFVASSVFRGNGISDNGETKYTIGEKSATVQVDGNTQAYALLSDIEPDVNGKVLVTVSKGSGAQAGYVNGMVIEAFDNPNASPGPAATKVTAYGTSRSTMQVDWVEVPQATSYYLYKATEADGPYHLDYVGSQTSYTDTGLSMGTHYFYKVETVYGTETSMSEVSVGTTLLNSVMINMNDDNQYNAPAPWNNLGILPGNGDAFNGLVDQDDYATGLELEFEQALTGANDWGMSTGNNSGVYPDKVLKSFFFMETDEVAKIVVRGLDQSMRYNFVFFNSIEMNFTVTTDFAIGNKTVVADATNNTTGTEAIRGVKPNENNEVIITITSPQNWSIFNAMIVEAYPYHQDGSEVTSIPNARMAFASPSSLSSNYASKVKIGDEVEKVLGNREIKAGPNPFDTYLNLTVDVEEATKEVYILMMDASGSIVYRSRVTLQTGEKEVTLDFSGKSLRKGLYLLKISDGNSIDKVIKLLKR
ncbi:fibronectin type III domain-containing protein [Rapidithrix thailandica]|uniref:Fibronectin type III domain-containing protein n=1 Tax=Rapidithrix thailandica TaxID=413964 RepID=A0AAW9SIC4_9BACT